MGAVQGRTSGGSEDGAESEILQKQSPSIGVSQDGGGTSVDQVQTTHSLCTGA